jgi:stage II sporulation protein AA (anti-sigma F factor antagonist)
METTYEKRNGVVIVAPAGRLDVNTSAELQKGLLDMLAAGETRFVVDLMGVVYISSAGLSALLLLAKKLKERSGHMALSSLGPAVRQVFEIAGLLPLFVVEASREQAVSRLAAGG